GSGSADRETADDLGRVQVPPDEESYTLRRVWLEDGEVEAYYHGFANQSLWPLCHMLIHYFEYRTEFWDRYRAVNLRFAHAVADEAERCTGRSMAWIQDYHFALVGGIPPRHRTGNVIPSVLAHPVSAAGHPALVTQRFARSAAARNARQRSDGVSDRTPRAEFSGLRGRVR